VFHVIFGEIVWYCVCPADGGHILMCVYLPFSKEMFPRSEGLARLAYQFAEKYEKIGGRSDRKRTKELYSASPDCIRPYKKVWIYFLGCTLAST
jgi:hypothetical protein